MGEIVRRYRKWVRGKLGWKFARNPVDIDDLEQEVWLRVEERMATFRRRDGSGFMGWLLSLCRASAFHMYWRRNSDGVTKWTEPRNREVVSMDQLPTGSADRLLRSDESPEQYAAERRRMAAVQEVVDDLVPWEADLLLRRDLGGESLDELAKEMATTSGAIQAATSRARRKLLAAAKEHPVLAESLAEAEARTPKHEGEYDPELVRRYLDGSLSADHFCKRHGVDRTRFFEWLKRYRSAAA